MTIETSVYFEELGKEFFVEIDRTYYHAADGYPCDGYDYDLVGIDSATSTKEYMYIESTLGINGKELEALYTEALEA